MRSIFPQTVSILMDRQTLITHREFWGTEPKQTLRSLTRLTAAEQQLCSELRDVLLGRNVRLEQERITFSAVGSEPPSVFIHSRFLQGSRCSCR
ncbi:hypothetical protein JAO29_14835 [Edaphobacter sp. HDX4]